MDEKTILYLIKLAKENANNNFCCNHSNFTVGWTLLTKDNKVYTGFNIENDGIQSICAERSAFCTALNKLNNEFTCLVVVGKYKSEENFIKTLPCGYCRQFLKEYTNKDFLIYTCDDKEQKIYKYTLEELLPESFSL